MIETPIFVASIEEAHRWNLNPALPKPVSVENSDQRGGDQIWDSLLIYMRLNSDYLYCYDLFKISLVISLWENSLL